MSARQAGLRHVGDDMPGIRRRRQGSGFRYLDPEGRPLRDREERRRIAALAIPPAWTEVWICPLSNGHLQATGRDARGRKQYRYHPDWRAVRDVTKFGRMVAFGEALPRLRERLDRDLARPGLAREKVLAAVVRLLETTLIRVGNEEYARDNNSFGLTTLRSRHVSIEGATLEFRFRGKSGKDHRVAVSDRRLARVVRACRELPGHELFQYLDEEGERQTVGSDDVNAYLREATGEDFTAKDFRTWGGTVLALSALLAAACEGEGAAPGRPLDRNRAVVEAVKRVSAQLGNRPAICRKYYIHPGVIDAFLAGTLEGEPAASAAAAPSGPSASAAPALSPQAVSPGDFLRLEEQTLALLRRLPPADRPPRQRSLARQLRLSLAGARSKARRERSRRGDGKRGP